MTAQELLDRFMYRDNHAVADFQNGYTGIEAQLQFQSNRLADVMTIAVFLLKKEVEREKAVTTEPNAAFIERIKESP